MEKTISDLSLLSRRGPGGADRKSAPAVAHVPEPRRRWVTRAVVPFVILAAALSLLAAAGWDAVAPAHEVRVVPVMSKQMSGESAAPVTVQAPGWVEPDPFAISVPALADGVVQEVLVLEGEAVRAGQVVARLVDADARLMLARAEAELAQREAAVETARAILNAAKNTWDHPTELTRALGTAEAMLSERRADLARWPSELAAEEATLKELESEYDRLKRLHEENQSSDIEFIRSRQAWERQKSVVESTRGREAILKAQVAAMEAEVAAARENLELRIAERRALEESTARLAEAEAARDLSRALRDEARLRVERMCIVSPADGVVLRRLVSPGAKLVMNTDNPASAEVIRLYDPSKLQVRVDIPLADAAAISIDQMAEVAVNVLPDRPFRGRVTRLVHEADIQKNTIQVKVSIESPSPEVKPEMLARVKFMGSASERGPIERERVFVPEEIVRTGAGGRAKLFLVTADGRTVSEREVTLGGARIAGWVEVAEGLQPGDRIVAGQTDSLSDGARVKVIGEARLAADGGK